MTIRTTTKSASTTVETPAAWNGHDDTVSSTSNYYQARVEAKFYGCCTSLTMLRHDCWSGDMTSNVSSSTAEASTSWWTKPSATTMPTTTTETRRIMKKRHINTQSLLPVLVFVVMIVPSSMAFTSRMKIHLDHHMYSQQFQRRNIYTTPQMAKSNVNKEQGNSQNNAIETKTKTTPKPKRIHRTWDENFQRLVKYQEEFGNCNVPRGYKEDPTLGNWVNTQRCRKRQSQLTEDQVSQLEDVGFVWSRYQAGFDEKFKRLKRYQQDHGHCCVPDDEDHELYGWVRSLRVRSGALTNENREKLEQLGFSWKGNAKDLKWDRMFDRLVQYQEVHGQCRLLKDFDKDIELRKWVVTQRDRHNNVGMPKDRIKKLNSVNFVWRENNHPGAHAKDEQWLKSFQRLVEYADKNGHTNVPKRYEADPKLGNWVYTQRKYYNNGKLLQPRMERLEGIGFQWNIRSKDKDTRWMTRYKELKQYYIDNGHFRGLTVTNNNLYEWLRNQRMRQANGRLQPERKALLEEVCKDFDWN